MTVTRIQQDYTLSALTYQLERLFELKSGSSLYEAAGLHLGTLGLHQIQTLLNTHPLADIQELCGLYLLTQHFNPDGLPALHAETREKLGPLLREFVPALLSELEELLRSSGINHDFFARTLILNEIEFLEKILRDAALEPKPLAQRTLFLKLCHPWLSLLNSQPTSPSSLLRYILNFYGWDERWQTVPTGTRPAPHQRQAPKHAIAHYKLHESGRLLLASLEKHEMQAETFQSELRTAVMQRLKNIPFHMSAEYEQHIREITQVVMQLALRKYPSVEKITSLLTETLLNSLPANHQGIRILILFSLTQEQVLGTQNLKYRLNDTTRGLAVSLARLCHAHPEWEQDLVWVWHALIDTILEVYESFNLADNALRSFSEAFMQEKQKLTHQSWKKIQPTLEQILNAQPT